jgi:chromosome segregation ATPase
MSESSSELERLVARLAAVRGEIRATESRAARLPLLERALLSVRRDQDSHQTADLRGAENDIERLLDRYRQAVQEVDRIVAKAERISDAGHHDLIETTPAWATAAADVQDAVTAVLMLLQEALPATALSARPLWLEGE